MFSGKDIFAGKQTYGVEVAPGVDLALIAALCICLDEKHNESRGASNASILSIGS